jgi:hypothetical protein
MKKIKKEKHKKLTEYKKMKLQRWVDWRIKNGEKDKGRAKSPVMTKSHGRIIY